MKADLRTKAVSAIVGALNTHKSIADRLLSNDEVTRDLFLEVVYEMLKNDISGGLISTAREA